MTTFKIYLAITKLFKKVRTFLSIVNKTSNSTKIIK